MTSLEADLSERLGAEAVSTRRSHRELASADESGLQACLPDVVVRPRSPEEVLLAVEICRRRRVPVTPRGAGTSLSGGPIPVRGGVVLDLGDLTEIEIDPGERVAVVQAGVSAEALRQAAEPYGLFLPAAPGGRATLGGLVATGSRGRYATGYGSLAEALLGATVVTGAGEIVRLGQRGAAAGGYDLARMLVGSEGTLAVIAEVTLRLEPLPDERHTVAVGLPDDAAAARALLAIHAAGVRPAACELLTRRSAAALAALKAYELEGAVLILEVHDSPERLERAVASCAAEGGRPLEALSDPWAAYHWVERAIRGAHPGCSLVRGEAVVPVTHLAELLDFGAELADRHHATLYAFGSALSGALELVLPASPEDLEAWDAALEVRDHVQELAIDRGGAATASHGVGLNARRTMKRQHGIAVGLMRRLKSAFDPEGILNPGKLVP